MLTAGCAGGPASRYDAAPPLTAHLPLRDAGIRDLRREFAARFDAELARDGAASGADRHLHLPAIAAAGASRLAEAAAGAFASTAVLVVPGLLGECFDDQALPFADGRVRDRATAYRDAYAAYRQELGLYRIEAVRVGGRAGSAANAVRIAEALRAQADDPAVAAIVVVAYSKGAADTIEALALLQRQRAFPTQLRAFVAVAGAVMGSPVADRYQALYEALAARIPLAACPVADGAALASLTTAHRARQLAESPPLPASVATYSVLAHAPRDHVGPGLRPFYDQLAAFDALNDGQLLAADSLLPRSGLLAVARSDHWDFVLPLASHPNPLVRGLASGLDYPRAALLRAVLRHVVADFAGAGDVAPASRARRSESELEQNPE